MTMRSSSALSASDSSRRRGTRIWSSMVVAVALAAVVVARTGAGSGPALFRLEDVAFERVAAERWVDAATLARGDTPTLVRGSPIDAWRARRWTADELAARAGGARHDVWDAGPRGLISYFNDEQPFAEPLRAAGAWRPAYARVNLTLREFFGACAASADARLYYSGLVREGEGAADGGDDECCAPVAPLVVPFDHAAAGAADGARGELRVEFEVAFPPSLSALQLAVLASVLREDELATLVGIMRLLSFARTVEVGDGLESVYCSRCAYDPGGDPRFCYPDARWRTWWRAMLYEGG